MTFRFFIDVESRDQAFANECYEDAQSLKGYDDIRPYLEIYTLNGKYRLDKFVELFIWEK